MCGTIGSVRARVCSSSLMPPVLRACGKEQKFTYAAHAGMPIRCGMMCVLGMVRMCPEVSPRRCYH